jgi:predicted membrane channel-forming protein YqfA (hemolysin III family)
MRHLPWQRKLSVSLCVFVRRFIHATRGDQIRVRLYGVLGLVWALAAVGAIAKLFFWARLRWALASTWGLAGSASPFVSSLIPLVSG